MEKITFEWNTSLEEGKDKGFVLGLFKSKSGKLINVQYVCYTPDEGWIFGSTLEPIPDNAESLVAWVSDTELIPKN